MKVLVASFVSLALAGATFAGELASAAELAKLQENAVPAIGQNAQDMVGLTTRGGLRVLFMGNSITRHGPRPEIGWTNNWGMAASCPAKDYAHVLAELIRTKYPDASFGLIQVAAKIERALEGVDLAPFAWARDWKPDVITLFYGANVPGTYDTHPYDGRFTRETEKVLDYIDPEHRAKVFHAEGFYIRPTLDWEKRLMVGRRGEVYVPMDDIRRRKDTHGGWNHPNDFGMRLIAERFWCFIEPELAGADGVRATGDFDVRAFGAKGDGVTKDTTALQKAIDACATAGGGRVVLTSGTYLTGALRMKSGVELHLQMKARLLASPDVADFSDWTDLRHVTLSALPRGRSACVLFADEAYDIAITGPGVIDGNGAHHVVPEPPNHAGWPFRRRLPPEQSLPRVVFFTGCRNVTVKGVTLVNPPAGWSYWMHDCDRVVFRDCRIEADVRYPNNDGIHINGCRDVEIANCDITTGDDSIVVRANSRSLAENRACARVTVSNCVLRSWSAGVRLGWTNDGTIRDCRFTDLTMRDTSVGVAYSLPGVHGTDYGREATTLDNIVFENIRMDSIYARPVLVKFAAPEAGTRVGTVSNVVFRNVTCRGLERPLVLGRPGVDLDGMVFENCRFDVVPETELPDGRHHGAAAWDRLPARDPADGGLCLSTFQEHIVSMARTRGMSIGAAAREMRFWGIDGVELWAFEQEETTEEILRAGFRPTSVVYFADFPHTNDLKAIDHVFDYAKRTGAPRIMLVPGFLRKGEDRAQAWAAAKPRMAEFVRRAESNGLEVVCEDFDMKTVVVGSGEHLRELFAEFPTVGHVLDTGNYAFWNEDVLKYLDAFRPRIRHVHIKDRAKDGSFRSVAAGAGTIPIREVLNRLSATGYRGWYTLECFAGTNTWKGVSDSAAFFRSVGAAH